MSKKHQHLLNLKVCGQGIRVTIALQGVSQLLKQSGSF